jgi:hypothetical protein
MFSLKEFIHRKSSIENFVERITSGDAKAEELAVLPGVLSVYC